MKDAPKMILEQKYAELLAQAKAAEEGSSSSSDDSNSSNDSNDSSSLSSDSNDSVIESTSIKIAQVKNIESA
jgi:hypothetical protein